MNKLGVKEIEQILPHRHPFLLVDYIPRIMSRANLLSVINA